MKRYAMRVQPLLMIALAAVASIQLPRTPVAQTRAASVVPPGGTRS